MESHLVRIINRLEAMAKDGGNLKRNFERDQNPFCLTNRIFLFPKITKIFIVTTSQSCNLFTCFTPQSCYNESIEI